MEAVWLQPARALAAADHRGGGKSRQAQRLQPGGAPGAEHAVAFLVAVGIESRMRGATAPGPATAVSDIALKRVLSCDVIEKVGVPAWL